jgi:hypothetical protein
MSAALVPHANIPALADRVTPGMLKVLQRVQKADFIMNGDAVGRDTVEILRQLTELGLVDLGYDGDTTGPPAMWVANGNGSRVLVYLTGIRGGPHYEVPAVELAAWLQQQGPDRWWNVDGDPLLTGRLTFPCQAKILAAQIWNIGRPLLIQAKKEDVEAKGQVIGREALDSVVDRLANDIHQIRGGEMPPWSDDRILYVCWKGATDEWLLAEDSETTVLMAADHGVGKDNARVEKR